MADPTNTSPFAKLDTSLMRSTKSVPPSETQETRKHVSNKSPLPPELKSDKAQVDQSTNEPTKQAPMERTNEPTMKRTNERLTERTKIRHTFDILADQLFSLREIALEREKSVRKRVLIGDLVQEALDIFITKERNKE